MATLANCNESLGALYFINGRGDVLIQRIYRDDIECVGGAAAVWMAATAMVLLLLAAA